MSFTRFALYYLPPEGPLADFGATWLGWDVARGCAAPQPELPGLYDATTAPRKYGFHATLKPPFRLREGVRDEDLEAACSKLARGLAPAVCEGLALTTLGRFLALTPEGGQTPLQRVAEVCVRELDQFRAPLRTQELARRRKANLNPRQEQLLTQWGYPYVMEEFRFHMTLTARLPKSDITAWTHAIQERLPDIPSPFVVDEIALCGERMDGHFEMIDRYALTG